jgi:formiminotetrahydrofolate cyclodeaminase
MKLVDLKVNDFTEKVASKSPAPGGGSVSALALSLGSALTNMVGALSTGKKVFKAKDEIIQQSFHHALESIRTSSLFFMDAIDKDTEAFNLIMDAFKMPKENENDKKQRSDAIQNATLKAIEVPFEVANEGVNVLKQLDIIVQHGNKNTISDIGVAVLMITAGIEGAILNVKINLSGLKNESLREDYNNKVNEILNTIKTIKDDLLKKVYQGL